MKKSKATPYTIIERTNIQTPLPGSPIPNSPNLNTHATIAMSITFLMPKRWRKNGMSKIHKASDICDNDVRSVALLAPNVLAYSAIPLKLVINGVA